MPVICILPPMFLPYTPHPRKRLGHTDLLRALVLARQWTTVQATMNTGNKAHDRITFSNDMYTVLCKQVIARDYHVQLFEDPQIG
jgi:hypothetical protein